MKKVKVKTNKPLYLGMSILDISKALMYEFWYDYVKPKYNDKVKLCYVDTDIFVINIFTEDILMKLIMMLKDGLIHLTDKNDEIPLQIDLNTRWKNYEKSLRT